MRQDHFHIQTGLLIETNDLIRNLFISGLLVQAQIVIMQGTITWLQSGNNASPDKIYMLSQY